MDLVGLLIDACIKNSMTMSAVELSIYLIAIIAYFVPFYIARYRHVNGQQLVFWLNLLLGWTLFAWIILIVVSLSLQGNREGTHQFSS
jgi:hypothetical protein